MANVGLVSNGTASAAASKQSGSPLLVVILVVVLSILFLCVSGIALVIYSRRRMQGKKYSRLQPSSDSSDSTAIENYPASNPRSNPRRSWFLQYFNIFPSPSPPDPYGPVQLHSNRPAAKVGNHFLDPNLPRSPPVTTITNSPSPAPNRLTPGPTPRLTPRPTPTPRLTTPGPTPGPTPRPTPRNTPTPALLIHPPTPQSPSRGYTVPIPAVSQSVQRIAPLPDNSIPRPRPVRAPSGPIVLPTLDRTPPSRPPIEVVNINRPTDFTIDDTPPVSVKIDIGASLFRKPRHLRSYSDSHPVAGPAQHVQPIVSPVGTFQSSQLGANSQDSDSVQEQRREKRRSRSFNQPPSSHPSISSPTSDGSASTTISNAGSSRPPTLTFRNLLLNFPRTPNQVPTLKQLKLNVEQSPSPPYHRTQFHEPHPRSQGPLYTQRHPHHAPNQSRQHLPFTRQHSRERELQRSPEPIRRILSPSNAGQAGDTSGHGDQRHEREPRRSEERLFPGSVVGAGYQTQRLPNPLLHTTTAETRQFTPTVAPPPTPNSWAQTRVNRL